MKSIIAALLFGALAIVATTTTASAKVKRGETYNWVYQLVEVYLHSGQIIRSHQSYVSKSACEAEAKSDKYRTYVCIRKQP